MAPATMGWDLPTNFKKILYRFAYGPIIWKHFLNCGPLLSDDFNFYEVDIKLSSTDVYHVNI